MNSVKDIQKDLSTLHDFHDIMETYEEIAAIRMRKVKKSVLLEREFLKGLGDVFRFVEMAYDTYLMKIGKYSKGKKRHFLKTNNKDVLVMLSANMGLYGEIVHKTMNKFMEDTKKSNADLVVLGKRGKRVFESLLPDRPFQYFEFSDSGTDDENLKRVLDYVLQYKNIYVYHGVFDSLLNQQVNVNNITGDISKFAYKEEGPQEGDVQDPKFGFFEPSIEDVAAFFETQTLAVMFEQATNESSLSKFASRMVSLDMAVSNINESILKTNFDLKKMKHRTFNKKQITLISSIFAQRAASARG